MAKAKNRKPGSYDDDDEIDASIKEFQADRMQSDEEESKEKYVDADDVDVIEPEVTEPEVIRPGMQDAPIATQTDMMPPAAKPKMKAITCSCCGLDWQVDEFMNLGRPCGCSIHPTCNQCKKCEGHCVCHEVVSANNPSH